MWSFFGCSNISGSSRLDCYLLPQRMVFERFMLEVVHELFIPSKQRYARNQWESFGYYSPENISQNLAIEMLPYQFFTRSS